MPQAGKRRWRTAWRWTGIGFFFAGFLSLCAAAAYLFVFHSYISIYFGGYLYPPKWYEVFWYGGHALILAGCVAFGLMQYGSCQSQKGRQPTCVPPQTGRTYVKDDEDEQKAYSPHHMLNHFWENAGFDGEEEPLDAITKVICVHCRKEYDWDYPKCPHCGASNDVLLRKRRE